MQSLKLTCAKIKECWVKAAEGSISVLFAAWLTTAAFEDVRRRFNGGPVCSTLEVWDHEDLLAKHRTLLKVAMDENDEIDQNDQTGSLIMTILPFIAHGLSTPWVAILDSKGRTYTKRELSESVLQKPEEHVKVEENTEGRQRAERSLMDLLLQSIRRILYQNGNTPSDLVLKMNPLLRPLQIFYETKGSSIQTDVVFGLHLLVESYKSFTLPKRLLTTRNGRVQMLRLAQDVKSSLVRARLLRPLVVNIMCDCSDCRKDGLWDSLPNFERELAGATEKRFDLYFQAPWVAGHQMNEILSRATDLGLRLCNRGQYLGTVLHLYNVLRQYDAIDEETILLEKLCAVVAQGVFSGSRPDCNFFAKYAVFQGGRICFDRSSKRHIQDEICSCCGNKIEPSIGAYRNWRIRMDKRSTKQLDSHDISSFHGLHRCSFLPGCHCWPHIWHGLSKGKNATDKQLSQVRDELSVHPCASILDHLEGVVGAEFEGDFPVAKVNWLEVYITCTGILANLSRAIQPKAECLTVELASNDELWTFRGQILVEKLLSLADGSGFVATYWLEVEDAKKAIRTALEGKKYSYALA